MEPRALKVGELARRTGVTVRTLHYYEQAGLLKPSHRTPAGHRLYTSRDIARLLQIKSLQQLGFSLREVRDCLERRRFSAARVLELHVARLREQVGWQQQLLGHLERIGHRLHAAEEVSVSEFLEAIKEVTMTEKYYTPEQRQQLKQRAQTVGAARIEQVQAEWLELFEQFRAAQEKGADPASQPVQVLARKALGLIQEFTGGDPGIEGSLSKMYKQEGGPKVMAQHGVQMAPGLWDYMQKAMAAARQ